MFNRILLAHLVCTFLPSSRYENYSSHTLWSVVLINVRFASGNSSWQRRPQLEGLFWYQEKASWYQKIISVMQVKRFQLVDYFAAKMTSIVGIILISRGINIIWILKILRGKHNDITYYAEWHIVLCCFARMIVCDLRSVCSDGTIYFAASVGRIAVKRAN